MNVVLLRGTRSMCMWSRKTEMGNTFWLFLHSTSTGRHEVLKVHPLSNWAVSRCLGRSEEFNQLAVWLELLELLLPAVNVSFLSSLRWWRLISLETEARTLLDCKSSSTKSPVHSSAVCSYSGISSSCQTLPLTFLGSNWKIKRFPHIVSSENLHDLCSSWPISYIGVRKFFLKSLSFDLFWLPSADPHPAYRGMWSYDMYAV